MSRPPSASIWWVEPCTAYWAGRSFAAIILVATVHLGWHYAIDGYAGILSAWLLWWACGRLVRWPIMQRLLWSETRRPAATPAP